MQQVSSKLNAAKKNLKKTPHQFISLHRQLHLLIRQPLGLAEHLHDLLYGVCSRGGGEVAHVAQVFVR